MFAVQAQGKNIRTVEGLAQDGTLHPLQRAFMAHHGLQCGFCTPGFLMLAVAMLEHDPGIGEDDMLDVLSSNLCRCTGYQNIVKAVKAAQAELRPAEAEAIEPPQPEAEPSLQQTPSEPELLEQAETAPES
jgi:aerobic-type carbon monoxide dehydrogenase small subunit (CoxS/CutS family)